MGMCRFQEFPKIVVFHYKVTEMRIAVFLVYVEASTCGNPLYQHIQAVDSTRKSPNVSMLRSRWLLY